MRWATFAVPALVAAAAFGADGVRAEDPHVTVAGTEWGSAPGCKVEVVRFHEDGTAHVLFDSAYDFVDAEEATWNQQGNALVLMVNGREYRGSLDRQELNLVPVVITARKGPCAFHQSAAVRGG
jgi:hypothetical protein